MVNLQKLQKQSYQAKLKKLRKTFLDPHRKCISHQPKNKKKKNMGKNITCETYCGGKVHFKLATSGVASHLCVGSKTKASVVGLMCFGLTV